MSEFISLICPSCGGHVRADQMLEKFFCNHCGTELLLRQDDDGVLSTYRVQELQASTKFKELQTTKVAIDAVKEQINQIEEQSSELHSTFLRMYLDNLRKNLGQKLYKAVNKYLNNERGFSEYTQKYLWNIPPDFYTQKHRGMETIEDFFKLYTYFSIKSNDKICSQIAQSLLPVVKLQEQLKEKKAELERLQDEIISRQNPQIGK